MNIDKLVKMANQIGASFETWPDHAAARDEVADHLRRFWDPRMRSALVSHADARGGESGLSPLVTAAVVTLTGGPTP